MEQQLSCSLGGEKVNNSSSTQDVTSLIPTEIRNMAARAKNVDVDIVLTQLHGPSYQHSPTRCPSYQHSPTQTTVHTFANTNQISPLTTNQTTYILPVAVSGSQTDQSVTTGQSSQPSKACLEKDFHKNKKVLKTGIAKATEQLDKLKELEHRSSKSFLEVEKPVFECCEVTDPLNFLEHLDVYLKRVPTEKKLDTILTTLEKCAQRWAEAVKEYWTDYDDFKKSFIAKFWGNAEQNLLRREITYGRYTNEIKDGPMANYFINLVAQARWLPNQIPDESLIFDLMQHFPKPIQVAWYNSQRSTVLEAVEFLRKMDEIEMMSHPSNKRKKCKYKVCPKEEEKEDQLNFKKSVKNRIEELQKSINKVAATKEGIKIAEAASKMLPQSQREPAVCAFNDKVLSAIQKVNNINTEICELEESIGSDVNKNKRPYFISPQSSHPLNFLEDLMEYMEKIPEEHRTVDYIVDCLYGDAYRWAMIFRERWFTVEDFRRDFLEQYWSPAEQSLLKREIICSDWDIKSETMSQHFTRLVTQAQLLTPPIPEDELVLDIMCHFSERLQDAWQSSGKSGIEEATAFLQKKDEEIYCKSQQVYNAREEKTVIQNASYKLNQSKENNEETSRQSSSTQNKGEIAKFVREKSKESQKKK